MRLILHVFGTEFDLQIGPIPAPEPEAYEAAGSLTTSDISFGFIGDETQRYLWYDDEDGDI